MIVLNYDINLFSLIMYKIGKIKKKNKKKNKKKQTNYDIND